MSDLLRVYFDPVEIGADGYPHAWHKPGWRALLQDAEEFIPKDDLKNLEFLAKLIGEKEEDGLSIKDYVRELAGNRCVRCGHPYRKGEHEMEVLEDGSKVSWSPCIEQCTHGGPIRVREAHLGDEAEWEHWSSDAECGRVILAGEWIHDEGPGGQRIARWDVQAAWRILTVHHLNGVKHDCRWWNLASLCQRCHLTIQSKVYMERVYDKPHSDWFRPYAAGFYAWKYLDQELTREETVERLDELLALELRQDALF